MSTATPATLSKPRPISWLDELVPTLSATNWMVKSLVVSGMPLVAFIKRCDPENVVVMHSGHPEKLVEDPELEGYDLVLPETGRPFTLPG